MAGFYWPLLRQVFATLVSATGRVRTVVVLIVALLTAFNQTLASRLMKTWDGFSPWYAMGVVLAFLLWETARVNYATFRTLGGIAEPKTVKRQLYSFFHADMEPAYKAAFGLLSGIADRLSLPDEDSALETTIRVAVLDTADAAFSDLTNALREGGHSILATLWEATQTYDRMGKTLEAILPSTMTWGGLDNAVDLWRRADQRFHEALDELLTNHEYVVLREAIETNRRMQVTTAWPVRHPSVLDLPYGGTLQIGTPVLPPEPLLMRYEDYARDVKVPLEADNWEIVEPDPAGVYPLERRGYQLVYKEHQGQSRQVVYGGTAERPSNVPMRRRKLGDDTKRLLRTAYRNTEFRVRIVSFPGGLMVTLDDGQNLTGYRARDALEEAKTHDLLVQDSVDPPTYCLTAAGKIRARDYSERGQ